MAYQGSYGGPPPHPQGAYQQPSPGHHSPPYPPQPHGYPPAAPAAAAAGYPPTSGYQAGQAPYGQPQAQQYYPSQGPYGTPPPGNYGSPAPGPYHAGAQGSYGPPAQAGYGGPSPGPYAAPLPPSSYGPPSTGPYGAPSQGSFGGPAPGGAYGAVPGGYPGAHPAQPQPGVSHPPYGQAAGPQQGYGPGPAYVQPVPPSLGYVSGQMAPGDASQDAETLYRAMKGFGTDERTLIRVLSRKDPLQMALLTSTFQRQYGKSLQVWIQSETGDYFREGLLALVRGPLQQDVYNAHRALKGMGTKETLLNDVVLSRSNADLNAIKQEFYRAYHFPLEKEVREDLSLKTEKLFTMVLAARRAEESAPVIPQQVDQDVADLYRATEGRSGTDQVVVCQIFSSRSDAQLRAIALEYELRYRSWLDRVIEKEFSGHMVDALLMILRGGTDRAMRDAMLLEDTMRGAGTKDDLLLNRVIRYHWDRTHLNQVKGAYRHRYQLDLATRIQGDTRGDFQRLLLACIE